MIKLFTVLKSYIADLVLSDANYFGDGLAVWGKNVDFVNNPRFSTAYNQAINSGHKFIGTNVKLEWRVNTAIWAAQQVINLEGDFVECGVNTGILSVAICSYLNFNQVDKSFYLFDTYNGIPEDEVGYIENSSNLKKKNDSYSECYKTAKKNFSLWPRARLIRGVVPASLEEEKIEKVCYLSLDMNVVVPEIAALHYYWPKLVSGAVVLLDDYGWETCENQKIAFDNFAQEVGVPILFLPTGQGIIVKP